MHAITEAKDFSSNPIDELLSSADNIENEAKKFRKKFQYYPTPKSVLDIIGGFIDIGRDMQVLEPQAGRGHVCKWLKETFHQAFANHNASLDVYEINPHFHNELSKHGNVIGYDFLKSKPKTENTYDLIIMNPPFKGLLWLKHFQHAYEHFLKPGGRIISVMPCNWYSSPNTVNSSEVSEFKHWLGYYFHDMTFLNKNTFQDSGVSSLETGLLMLDKPLDE